jgi:hypothetical protein
MGLSNTQLRSLLVREEGILIVLGTLVGVGIRFGLVMLMQPFLLQILPPLDGKFVFNQFLINWFDLAVRLVILVGFYVIGLLLLTISASRFQRSL